MASPRLSNQFTPSSFNSLRQSLSSASSFQARDPSIHTGEEIPLSENIRYNRDNRNIHGEGEVEDVFINDNNTNDNSRRESLALSSQPPQSNDHLLDNNDDDEGLICY